MKFQVIVSDPPWRMQDKLTMSKTKRGADANYNTMSLVEICDLQVKDITDPRGCIVALWCLGSMLEEALQVMKAWGFNHKQTFVWVKVKKARKATKKNPQPALHNVEDCLAFGMGRLFRQTHELCLIGTSNNGIYKKLKNRSQRSVSFDENKKHSAKPEKLQDFLDIMFPDTEKFEMFARRKRTGWTVAGNEVCDGEDIRDSIKRLKAQ